jgi:hypothetical protein
MERLFSDVPRKYVEVRQVESPLMTANRRGIRITGSALENYLAKRIQKEYGKINPMQTPPPPAVRGETRNFLNHFCLRENCGLNHLLTMDLAAWWSSWRDAMVDSTTSLIRSSVDSP